MIVSDARAFQSTSKMQLFDHPSSNFNLRVRRIFYHAPHGLTYIWHRRLGEAMVSASVSTGSWVTQKPDSWVAVFVAAGTGGQLVLRRQWLAFAPSPVSGAGFAARRPVVGLWLSVALWDARREKHFERLWGPTPTARFPAITAYRNHLTYKKLK